MSKAIYKQNDEDNSYVNNQDALNSDSLNSENKTQDAQISLTIKAPKEGGWSLVFLVSLTLGVILFGFGLSSIVGYTLNRKKISTQTMTQEQIEELYSELRSAVLLFMISTTLLVVMLFTGYRTILSLL